MTQGVCLYPDYPDGGAPPDASPDGGGGGADANVPCARTDSPGAQVPCNVDGGKCAGGDLCCVGESKEQCVSGSGTCTDKTVQCTGPTQCTTRCCVKTTTPLHTFACPVAIPYSNFVYAKCNNACVGSEVRACLTDADCPIGRCYRATLMHDGGTVDLGMCL